MTEREKKIRRVVAKYGRRGPESMLALPIEEIRYLLDEVERLREWIRGEGMDNDTCTYNVLGEICDGCRCGKIDNPTATD